MKVKVPFFTSFIHPEDSLVTSTLKTIFTNYFIKDLRTDNYYLTIALENGKDIVIVQGWIANNWYGFLDRGTICLNDKPILQWNDSRPSRKVMNLILQKCNNYLQHKFKGIMIK